MARLYKGVSLGDQDHLNPAAELLIENLEIAENLWQRGVGLLGRTKLNDDQALWIKATNNIHTCFMKFSIDCIFVDRKLEIKKIVKSVPGFRLVGPYWKANSVIEANAGFAESKNLKVGDQLYVVG